MIKSSDPSAQTRKRPLAILRLPGFGMIWIHTKGISNSSASILPHAKPSPTLQAPKVTNRQLITRNSKVNKSFLIYFYHCITIIFVKQMNLSINFNKKCLHFSIK